MRLFLSFCLLTMFSISCASHHPGSEAERDAKIAAMEPAYGGNCAMGMCKRMTVKGKHKYTVDYKGNRYLFSSEKARDQFLSNIDSNIQKANAEWVGRGNGNKVQ